MTNADPKKALSPAERRAKADAKKRREGLVPLHLWVPADKKQAVLAYVKDLTTP